MTGGPHSTQPRPPRRPALRATLLHRPSRWRQKARPSQTDPHRLFFIVKARTRTTLVTLDLPPGYKPLRPIRQQAAREEMHHVDTGRYNFSRPFADLDGPWLAIAQGFNL